MTAKTNQIIDPTTDRLVYIAEQFSRGVLGENVAKAFNKSPAWLSILLKKHAPELSGKNTERRKRAAVRWLAQNSKDKAAEAKLLETIKSMNVDQDLIDLDGMSLDIAYCFGMGDVCTLDDLAGMVWDDITGYTEVQDDGSLYHEQGVAEDLGLSRTFAGYLILQARFKLGWIDQDPSPARIKENTTCTAIAKDGSTCGAPVRVGHKFCRTCWGRSLPASYAAIMSDHEIENLYNNPKKD